MILIFFKVTKFLITTGYDGKGDGGVNLGNPVSTSELIDLSLDDDDQCFNWVDYPHAISRAMGGLLGKTPLICGGFSYNKVIDECYSLNGESSKFVSKMLTMRDGAASIVLNETILWVSGGWDGIEYISNTETLHHSWLHLASSEYITLAGNSPGPDLPMSLDGHAMIAINRTHSIVIGGSKLNEITIDLTFYFNHGIQKWIDGPRLIKARENHAVGIVIDQLTMANLVIITGGFIRFTDDELYSTEILVDSQFSPGKIRHTLR